MNEMYQALLVRAADEATRLVELVDELTEKLSMAEAQHALVADWSEARIGLLRTALQDDRFADVAGYTTALERAEAELGVMQELRRRLAGEHT